MTSSSICGVIVLTLNIIVLTIESTNGAWTYCKDGWLPFNGSCYWFGRNPVHFTEAEHYCIQHESHLIHVNTEMENLFIKDHLRALKSNNFWIGMTDETIEDAWVWLDTDESIGWADWGPNQPDVGNDEDCGVFWEGFDFQWGDLGCTQDAIAVCEMTGELVNGESIVGKRHLR